ncbi:hypothetical protein FOQG_02565 [Fusarium oxysporum f. sp. raphani 54005]|uniref:Uncharacterized protein n=2 Tax=Fusarium oxysporum f. sp. raphani TaxID=96318 RepID=X0DSU5_FUSOX|nr:hypothetical protein FOQG_02565 [Fusarium oxysporum f. sp. raphani 54005]KAG7434602.1 hypothetical protein Forpi1262_v004265 [Fusarium oxysporum f. sp. raphani]
MPTISSACSADLATTLTSSKWPSLISASCGSSPHGSSQDQAIHLDTWRPHPSVRDSKSFTPDIKLEEIPPNVDEHAPPDAQGRYLIKDEEGDFPCTQVIANTILNEWRRQNGRAEVIPSYLAGANEPAHKVRFLGDEHPPEAGPSNFKVDDLPPLIGRSCFSLGTRWKFLNLEGRTYWQHSDP